MCWWRKCRQGNNIALITDAGTPGISDPGEDLVRLCYEAGIDGDVPAGSLRLRDGSDAVRSWHQRGFALRHFCPWTRRNGRRFWNELKEETRTIIVYEAPHRLVRTLGELLEALGNRRLTICRELTKKHETAFQTTLEEALEYYQEQEPRGECVLVLEGKSREQVRLEAAAVLGIHQH